MEEGWKETMTPKNLGLVEEERKPKLRLKPLAKAWEEYKEAQREAQIAKRRLWEDAQKNMESAEEVQRRQQGAFMREMRVRHAEKQAKATVQAPQPVPEEEDNAIDDDKEEPEAGEEVTGTRTLRLRWWQRWLHHGMCVSRWK